MITNMIPNVENVFKNHHITDLTFLSVHNPFPDNALVDESGNFILDENNNFIIVE